MKFRNALFAVTDFPKRHGRFQDAPPRVLVGTRAKIVSIVSRSPGAVSRSVSSNARPIFSPGLEKKKKPPIFGPGMPFRVYPLPRLHTQGRRDGKTTRYVSARRRNCQLQVYDISLRTIIIIYNIKSYISLNHVTIIIVISFKTDGPADSFYAIRGNDSVLKYR